MAPGPASWAARQAPNNQPDPMIEPKPVNISAMAPTSRRIALSLDMQNFSLESAVTVNPMGNTDRIS
jgi:hypothetical protein